MISPAQVGSSAAEVGRQVKMRRRLTESETPVTAYGPLTVMSRRCGSSVTPKLMLTSASVFSVGIRASSIGASNFWMNAADTLCGPAVTWMRAVFGSRLLAGSDSLMRSFSGITATRWPSMATSISSLRFMTLIVERP